MKQINRYIDSVFYHQNPLLEEVISSIKENGLPSTVSSLLRKAFNHAHIHFRG